ncbi:hypothetical protein ACJX0J_010885 [Zea mays]
MHASPAFIAHFFYFVPTILFGVHLACRFLHFGGSGIVGLCGGFWYRQSFREQKHIGCTYPCFMLSLHYNIALFFSSFFLHPVFMYNPIAVGLLMVFLLGDDKDEIWLGSFFLGKKDGFLLFLEPKRLLHTLKFDAIFNYAHAKICLGRCCYVAIMPFFMFAFSGYFTVAKTIIKKIEVEREIFLPTGGFFFLVFLMFFFHEQQQHP